MTTSEGFFDANGKYRETIKGRVDFPLNNFWLIAGTPLAAFANGASATPGLSTDNNEAGGIRWNNNATLTAVLSSRPLPLDRQPGTALKLHIECSKSGATVGDATTFDTQFFISPTGALTDASSSLGGTTAAIAAPTAAAKTAQHVSQVIAGSTVPVPTIDTPAIMTISVKPTDGTLGTDDLTIHDIYVEYVKLVSIGG